MRRNTRVTIAIAALAVLTTIAPPAAAAVGSPRPWFAKFDGFYTRIWEGSHRGLIMAEWTSTSDAARFSWGLSGLSAGSIYRVVGSRVNCGVPMTSADRTFRTSLVATSTGESFGVVAGNLIGTQKTRSVRIIGPAGGIWHCGISLNFSKIDVKSAASQPASAASSGARAPDEADAAYARSNSDFFLIIDQLTATTGRATTVLHGLEPGHDYRVVGRDASCHASGPGTRTYGYKLQDVLVSSFTSREIALTPESLQSTQSVRILDDTDLVQWRCAPQILIALLVP